jgi:hypothetical protein
LVERLVRNEEVSGSIPLGSTILVQFQIVESYSGWRDRQMTGRRAGAG